MLNKTIRILNFDNSILKQSILFSQYEHTVIDFKDFAPKARHWTDSKTRSLIEKRVVNSAKDSITFIGSGDFHHISEILISRFDQPISVIVFDAHPDWAGLSPQFSCGSWLNEILKKETIVKLVLMGISSDDISGFNIQTGNLNSLKNDRVEIYPHTHRPSTTFLKKIPPNASIGINRGVLFNRIFWNELKDKNLAGFIQTLLNRIPAKKVYISIDKDCLNNNHAITNWEEGKLSLEELLLMLRLIKQNMDIIGLDICGDYSPVSIQGGIKRIISRLDHPKDIKADELEDYVITAINQDTNLKILQCLSEEKANPE
ncbi:MAG: arginase family protein [Candidatus Omnitrophota bacterium]